MIKRQKVTVAFFALAAAMLLSSLATKAAEEAAVDKAKQTLELGSPFLNDMILQREMKVPVWGWATAGMRFRWPTIDGLRKDPLGPQFAQQVTQWFDINSEMGVKQ